jgi:hypothetical protein
MEKPLYPNVTVKLVGSDGNAFNIIALCRSEARKQGVPADKLNEFLNEAMESDYHNLLRVCMKWFNIE